MSASLQRIARTGPALRPVFRPTASLFSMTSPLVSSLRSNHTYRNPNDPAFDDEDDTGRPPLPQQKYKNKKVWPPDFTRLSPQEQLRFEKRYKRRVALASARPRWVKFVKLAQLFSVTFVVIYCVLFMEWEYGPQPFDGVREWFWNTLGLMKGGQNSAVRKAGEGSVATEKAEKADK